jgi:two-component system response regulator YesN
MYSVLIVDDEDPVIESISFMIEKYRPEIEIAGTAKSGREAIEKADEVKPDIVLIDVRMPGIDGLDAIREITQRNPGVLPILTTAYERFDIAQTAFELGVHDYILKPFSRTKLIGAIDSAVQRLERKPRYGSQDLKTLELVERLIPTIEELFFRTLDYGGDLRPFAQLFASAPGIDLFSGAPAVLQLAEEGADPDLQSRVADKIKYKYPCLCASGSVSGEILLFFPAREGRGEAPEQEKLFGILESGGIETRGMRYTRGETTDLAGLRDSFLRVKAAGLRVEYTERLVHRRRELERELMSHLRKREKSEFCTAAEDFVRAYGEGARMHGTGLSTAAARLEARAEVDTGLPERISLAERADELLPLLYSWADRLFEKVEERENEELPGVLRRAYEYIDSHYERPLQLSEVAGELRITPSYLSRLFSSYGSITFVDYLTNVRMERAKELLRSGEYSIKEISSFVGYHDPNYFSRIFKKVTGRAPTDYS